LFDAEAFPNHPRFGAIVEKVWQSLQAEKPAATQRLPHPKLILDLNRKRLAIEFAERGLNGGYRWDDGRMVGKSLVFLESDDFRQGLKGRIHQPDGSTEDWAIPVWYPVNRCWAAFRGGDGSYVGQKEKLSPGRYLLVLPEEIPLPSTAQVFGEYGWLQLPVGAEQSFVIFDCELPPGFEIPEIGLAVEPDAGSGSHFRSTARFITSRSAARPLTIEFCGARTSHKSRNSLCAYLISKLANLLRSACYINPICAHRSHFRVSCPRVRRSPSRLKRFGTP
jgi:hypothetical protein